MSDTKQTALHAAPDGDRIARTICYAGLLALPALMLFVHLLLIYRE
jgi:hypothetical protein